MPLLDGQLGACTQGSMEDRSAVTIEFSLKERRTLNTNRESLMMLVLCVCLVLSGLFAILRVLPRTVGLPFATGSSCGAIGPVSRTDGALSIIRTAQEILRAHSCGESSSSLAGMPAEPSFESKPAPRASQRVGPCC
jgi:hypothetical protein